MLKIKQKILNLYKRLQLIFSNPYFGFISGHNHVSEKEIEIMKSLVGNSDGLIVEEFESKFSKHIELKAVSFAAGRMAFYALLKALDLKAGDEVILTGSTCAVMANAVIRIGAKPVYADISIETFGTSAESVKNCISRNTKIIVAQHSFGIPCEIIELCKVAKLHDIFLLEDCALSLDSRINGKKLGTFGDAAIFSFDHTKPINAMIGGAICMEDDELYAKIKSLQQNSSELPTKKQKALFNRFLLERKYCNPHQYGLFQIIDYMLVLYSKVFRREDAFLMKDSGSRIYDDYSYPSKMPEFIGFLALIELKKWPSIKKERQDIMLKYIEKLKNFRCEPKVHEIYVKDHIEIIPLRFVFTHPDGLRLRRKMNYILDVGSIWFKTPIIGTVEPIENFEYVVGDCPVSETLNSTILNLPINIKEAELNKLLDVMEN